VQSLLHPEAFPHPADGLELKETHGAWIILAGPYAYKLKKPVDLGFFDYSTPELRAADAEAELLLNRRLAPSMYLAVVDVVKRDGRFSIGGEGRAVERAIWMRRLPEGGMLTALLARGEASSGLVHRIARILIDFHRTAPTGPGVDEYGAPAKHRSQLARELRADAWRRNRGRMNFWHYDPDGRGWYIYDRPGQRVHLAENRNHNTTLPRVRGQRGSLVLELLATSPRR
jgi:aminoglycoside phosphotransferase family enzyme